MCEQKLVHVGRVRFLDFAFRITLSFLRQTFIRPFAKCAAFAGMFSADKAKACTPSKGVLKEPMGNADDVEIPRLPGCNPLCK
jgi:hypothetical protein